MEYKAKAFIFPAMPCPSRRRSPLRERPNCKKDKFILEPDPQSCYHFLSRNLSYKSHGQRVNQNSMKHQSSDFFWGETKSASLARVDQDFAKMIAKENNTIGKVNQKTC